MCIDMDKQLFLLPDEIEKESFRIIQDNLDKMGIVLEGKKAPVIKRVIHTTADFSYVETLVFANDVIDRAHEFIRRKATIVTDTNMALAGINKSRLGKYGCEVRCFMADEEVAREAKARGVTRATVSMERAFNIEGPVIFVVGNAPTALIEIHRIMTEEGRVPDMVIGVPVGFVNVEYSKELFRDTKVPYIINFGRKGGSNVASAIVNALVLGIEQ